jgi:hypothetical protein
MRLLRKLLAVSILLTLFWTALIWYFSYYRGEYYFPDRYEDALATMLSATVFSAIVLLATVVWHFIGARRASK